MFCKYCGTEITNDSKFCTACGKNLYAAESTATVTSYGQNAVNSTNQTTTIPMQDVHPIPSQPVYRYQATANAYTYTPVDMHPQISHTRPDVKVYDGFFFRHVGRLNKIMLSLAAAVIALWTAVAVVMAVFPQYTHLF
jgi:nitrate/TMAO reductase-like tetraheme cytochrome c subunit